MKKVTAMLQGGLGNQLFIFFSGLFLADKIGAKLLINYSLIEKKSAKFGNLSNQIDISFGGKKLQLHEETRAISRVPELIKRIIYRAFGHRKHLRDLTFQFRSKVFGYDPQFELVAHSTQMYGYFQTHRYIDNLVARKGKLVLALSDPSAWFQGKKREIQSKHTSVGIHYRRGDYLKGGNLTTIGLLSDEYFMNAIQQIDDLDSATFYIFSDSTDQAEAFFSRLNLPSIEFISPPDGSSPMESLLLLSYCSYIIISNSTYSWWSAYLAKEVSRVFAPEPWFRNLESPQQLLLPSWHIIKSVWQD